MKYNNKLKLIQTFFIFLLLSSCLKSVPTTPIKEDNKIFGIKQNENDEVCWGTSFLRTPEIPLNCTASVEIKINDTIALAETTQSSELFTTPIGCGCGNFTAEGTIRYSGNNCNKSGVVQNVFNDAIYLPCCPIDAPRDSNGQCIFPERPDNENDNNCSCSKDGGKEIPASECENLANVVQSNSGESFGISSFNPNAKLNDLKDAVKELTELVNRIEITQKKIDNLTNRSASQAKIAELTAEINSDKERRNYLKTKLLDYLDSQRGNIRTEVNNLMKETYSYDNIPRPATLEDYQQTFLDLNDALIPMARAGNTVKLVKAASLLADQMLLLKYLIEDITAYSFNTQGFRTQALGSNAVAGAAANSMMNNVNTNRYTVAQNSVSITQSCPSCGPLWPPIGDKVDSIRNCKSSLSSVDLLSNPKDHTVVGVYNFDPNGPNLSIVIRPNNPNTVSLTESWTSLKDPFTGKNSTHKSRLDRLSKQVSIKVEKDDGTVIKENALQPVNLTNSNYKDDSTNIITIHRKDDKEKQTLITIANDPNNNYTEKEKEIITNLDKNTYDYKKNNSAGQVTAMEDSVELRGTDYSLGKNGYANVEEENNGVRSCCIDIEGESINLTIKFTPEIKNVPKIRPDSKENTIKMKLTKNGNSWEVSCIN